jgi:2-methylcitrate dehydratase PrpD
VLLSPTAYPIVGEPDHRKVHPANSVDAQFSVYFQVAAALLDGHVDWSSYQRLTDPGITTLAAHITVIEDVRLPRNGSTVIIDAGGQIVRTTINVPLGEPANWISDNQLREKFERHAGDTFGEGSKSIATAVLHMPLDMPVRDLTAQLRLPPQNQQEA